MDIVMILMAIEEKFGVYVPIDGQIAEAKDLTSFRPERRRLTFSRTHG